MLARGITDTFEPTSPTTEFPEDAAKIYVVLKSSTDKPVSVTATWHAVNVAELGRKWWMEHNPKIGDAHLFLPADKQAALWLEAPKGGFLPGDYQVKLNIRGGEAAALSFKVVPILPAAAFVEQENPPHGFNIALAAFGGRIESATSEHNERDWAAANLIDGLTYSFGGRSCRDSCGWQSKDETLPQEIVFSFHQHREPLVSAVVIDPTTHEVGVYGKNAEIPKHVEIWTSATSATDGFTKVGGARLQRRVAEQFITLPPTRTRYVKVRFLSNHGGTCMQAAEVKIIEAMQGAPSILGDAPRNLALPALGGAIVRYTSKGKHELIGQMVDGSTETPGWRSKDGYLPQDVVFAFRGDHSALIDRIVLNPATKYDSSTRPQLVTVAVSTDSPFDGFQEVGQFTLTTEARDQEFPIGRRARFLKLRILKNFGSTSFTSLGEVKLLEGTEAGYESVLLAPEQAATSSTVAMAPSADETGATVETEPNNT
ncbi:MAG TPA: hypothetical protein VGX03_09365, partial [Candidatus Binatia bacterium]|nr:hypothetical protein [Candidatus Binatia bacterium]